VYQCKSGKWVDTNSSIQGPPGLTNADGEVCPAGEYVDGFDINGNISCAPLPPSVNASGCPANDKFTFSVTSVKVGFIIYFQEWPGGTVTLTDPDHPGCSVTVQRPLGLISDIGGTAGTNGWTIQSWTGFTSASGVVHNPNCNSLSGSSVTNGNFPTCTDDDGNLNASTDDFVVTAS